MSTAAPYIGPSNLRESIRFAIGLTGAAFLAYFCMYAFRKPFLAGSYADSYFLGTSITLKTALVLSQLLGYATSKFIGIKCCSEASRHHRAWWLIGCIAIAELALVAFAWAPGGWKALAMFVNGLPLGLVWGFIIAYLEGRRCFEVLVAGLSCSFILASGLVKDIGAASLRLGVPESWMPAAVGILFLLPFLSAVWFLERAPEPSPEDVAARIQRLPMSVEERTHFLRLFGPGLVPLILLYLVLTAFRDYRDSYGIEIYQQLGYGSRAGIFTQSEILVAIGVFIGMMGLSIVRNNLRAIAIIYQLMLAGLLVIAVSTALLHSAHIGGFAWMLMIGLGSYLAYVPFGAILFDRLVAAAQCGGTVVFSIYFVDSIAYVGVVAVQLQHDFFLSRLSHLEFLTACSIGLPIVGIVLLAISWILIRKRFGRFESPSAFGFYSGIQS